MKKHVKLCALKLAASSLGVACCLLAGAVSGAQTKFPSGTFIGTDLPVTFTTTGKMFVKDKKVVVVEAIYTVSGDQIVFTDKQGKYACTEPAKAVGKYRWKYDGKALRFTKVEDRCESRIKILTMLRLSRQKQRPFQSSLNSSYHFQPARLIHTFPRRGWLNPLHRVVT